MLCTCALAHVHLPGYMNETAELPLPHELVLCLRRHLWQLLTVGICVTVAYEAVSCTEMYAVRSCECEMNNEQTKGVGAGTSVNKEY